MSMHSKDDVACAKCGHSQSIVIWQSLNASLDPDARADLLAGRINSFQCNSCGSTGILQVPLLYIDIPRVLIAWYHPPELLDHDSLSDAFDIYGSPHVHLLPLDYKGFIPHIHVVFDMGELVRYVLFRERLYERNRYWAEFDVDDGWFRPPFGASEVSAPRPDVPGPPCPKCGELLRTSKAQQCFECGADWHGQAPSSVND